MKRIHYFILAIAIFASSGFYFTARANPSFFVRSQSATATSTVSYMTPGTATTTIPSFDLGVSGAQGADSAVLALQFTGSTTPNNSAVATTTYNVAIEYSQDNVDWYSDSYSQFGTTTVAQNITTQTSRSISLGTQTIKGSLIASTTPTKVVINVPSPMRYVRAIISVAIGSTNGSVWGEFVAKRQGAQ